VSERLADRYAVMGDPIAHSLSPSIHQQFAKQTQQHLDYQKIHVSAEQFVEAVTEFQSQGGKGLNITLPLKQQAMAIADTCRERARLAAAANTLIFTSSEGIIADNTDGVGLLRDLKHNQGVVVAKRRLLLLGAGGAARGVIAPLLQEKPSCLHIANRTLSKAQQLQTVFADLGTITVSTYQALGSTAYDVIINATSASLQGELPALTEALLAKGCCCYDLMYGNEPTVFLRWAKQQGVVNCVDGLGMLVEQAAESFYLWRGVRPATLPVIQQLSA